MQIDPNKLSLHMIAKLFPEMETNTYHEFVEDIRQNGIREPVWIKDNKILDGRHRWRAAKDLGINLPFKEYTGDDIIGFVVSLNLHRRHLNESQRGMVAAKLANMPHGGDRSKGSIGPLTSNQQAATLLNVSEKTVKRARKVQDGGIEELQNKVMSGSLAVSAAADIAELSKEEQTKIIARDEKEIIEAAKEIRRKKQEANRRARIKKIASISAGNKELKTDQKYPVIYADPPWQYEHCETENRAIENQYPTMPLEDICNLPVSEIATDDCILFLWSTSPKLQEALRVVESWGFNYRTCAIWDKDKIGPGYYFRQQHEILLVATKGNIPTPEPANRPSSVYREKRTGHSKKPDQFYALIEGMYPELPRIELFSRQQKEGWNVWGNQSA